MITGRSHVACYYFHAFCGALSPGLVRSVTPLKSDSIVGIDPKVLPALTSDEKGRVNGVRGVMQSVLC